MKFIFALLTLLLTYNLTTAQPFSVAGSVQDTTDKKALFQASVVVLRAKDSVLVSFTRSVKDGLFKLSGLDSGKYLLLVTYPGYVDFADPIDVNGNKDVGQIALITKATALQNVIVRGSPVRMKGDTIAFIADSFKVREGATVEDLLKKLPGLQVNSKGEITAQGEKVQKVLVDGEEFFGADPTMATQNLQASLVKEVQVFDKKSDQATFTGIDDGEKTKTINLKMKDEAQKGYFGKLKLAAGAPENYNNELMLNRFTKQRKISVFGLMSNVNKGRLGWQDETNYGGGMNTEVFDDGGVGIWMQDDNIDQNANSDNEGLPTSWNVGGQFSNKWDADRQKLNGSYRLRNLRTNGGSQTTTQFILPDTQYINNEMSNYVTQRYLNRANGAYDFKIDSTQSLIFTASGNYGKNDLTGNYTSESLSPKGERVNQSLRQTSNIGFSGQMNTNLLWRKRLKKKGRTISTSIGQNYSNQNGDGFLTNYNTFFNLNGSTIRDTTDQKKENAQNNFGLNTRIAYTEPIGKKGILEVNYRLGFTNSDNKQFSFDKLGGKYDQLNQIFSNSFEYRTVAHTVGTAYKYTEKKYNFQIGGALLKNNWQQKDLFRDSLAKRSFTNFNGRANFYYKIKQQSGLRFSYDVRSENPTINQLQPLANNNNPLNILIGNPDLKLTLNHDINLNYNMYQVLGGRSIWSSISISPITNDISTSDSVDRLGRRFTQYINVAGNYNISGYFDYGQNIEKWDMNVGFNMNFNHTVRNSVANSTANKATSQRLDFGLYIGKRKDDKYDISARGNFAYNTSSSSIRADLSTTFWTFEPSLDIELDLPWKIRFETEATYNIRQKTNIFAGNNNVLLWHANINKKVGKKQDIRVGLMVNDILNQNQGFNREINSNFVSERTTVVLRRYGAVTFSWIFNKNGKPQEGW